MSTTEVTPNVATPPATEVTVNNSAAEINAAIAAAKQEAAAVPAPTTTTTTETPATPQSVTLKKEGDAYYVKLETGEEFKGTPEEILVKLGEAKVNTKKWADEQVKKATTPPPTPATPAPTVEVDPAEEFILDTVAKGIGLNSAAELKAMIQRTQQAEQQQQEQRVAMEFHRMAPDFPATKEASDAVLEYCATNGINPTPGGLKAAHLACVSEGKYKPLTAEQINAKTTGIRPAPAPVVTSTASTVNSQNDFSHINVNSSMKEINAAIAAAKAAGR